MACNERVGKGVITYPCTLADGHTGPHTSNESSVSQRERARWETEQAAKIRHAQTGLAEFQGIAQTTAERYTENPTKVPVSAGRARLHAECSKVACLVYDGDVGNRISAWSECPYEPGPPPREQAVFATLDKGTPHEEVVLIAEADDRVTITRGAPAGSDGGEVTSQAYKEVGPTKTREGDQVLPTGDTSQPDIQSQVIRDIEQRRQVGIDRYGQALQPFNGRKTLLDAYEEALDLTVYLRSLLVMQHATRERMIGAVQVEMYSALGSLFQGDTAHQVAHELAEKAVDRMIDAFAHPGIQG